ncbi:hypothetical protein D3C71_533780 [compost metagenome]
MEVSELKESSEEIESLESSAVTLEVPLKEVVEDTVSSIDEQKVKKTVGTRCIASQQQIDNLSLQDSNQPIPEVKKKTEPLTWVSLALFIGIGISIGLISIFSSFLYLGTGIFLGGLALVMFICSLISLIKVHRNPDRYKNKGLTKFMFTLSILCLVAVAIYLLSVVAIASMKPMMQGI